jgi:hypothetical protein
VVPAASGNNLHVGQSPFVPAAFTVGDADALNAKDRKLSVAPTAMACRPALPPPADGVLSGMNRSEAFTRP